MVLSGLGRRQDADSVHCGEFGKAGWVGRDGIRQPERSGGFSGCCDELIESAGLPGPACDTWKPCGVPDGRNTSEPGPAALPGPARDLLVSRGSRECGTHGRKRFAYGILPRGAFVLVNGLWLG